MNESDSISQTSALAAEGQSLGKSLLPANATANSAEGQRRKRWPRSKLRTREEFIARFWEKIDVRGPDECWPWKAATAGGYGRFTSVNFADGEVRAHRFSYILAFGPIPGGLHVLHKCDNPPCCNPAHFFLGTLVDNDNDRHRKGRTPWGEKAPRAKLTASQVQEIRRRYVPNVDGLKRRIAADFEISEQTVQDIATGRSWRRLPFAS